MKVLIIPAPEFEFYWLGNRRVDKLKTARARERRKRKHDAVLLAVVAGVMLLVSLPGWLMAAVRV